MKVVQINTFPYKATGNIMFGIHKTLKESGHDSYVVWGRGRDAENDDEIVIKNELEMKLHGIYTRITDRTGFGSKKATCVLLDHLKRIAPDIVHLHNVHGYYLNIEMLFDYIRENRIRTVWTFHDCWPITGHCAFFDMVECEKWKNGCHDCQQKSVYPASKFADSSRWNWEKKKTLFDGLDITIVTPSQWLKDIVGESFMKSYPTTVIHNGIDLNAFVPSFCMEVRRKYCSDEIPLILGVASEWTERKGLNDFFRLSECCLDMQFVVVGVTQEQLKNLPRQMKGLLRTNNVEELAKLYSVADVFLNPTYEDNFPTTNLEALACGTPVVTYDTGGSPEAIQLAANNGIEGIGKIIQKTTSMAVDYGVVEREIRTILETAALGKNTEKCRKAAVQFDRSHRFKQYVDLYELILSRAKYS